jgi:hypothetical protein
VALRGVTGLGLTVRRDFPRSCPRRGAHRGHLLEGLQALRLLLGHQPGRVGGRQEPQRRARHLRRFGRAGNAGALPIRWPPPS